VAKAMYLDLRFSWCINAAMLLIVSIVKSFMVRSLDNEVGVSGYVKGGGVLHQFCYLLFCHGGAD